MNTFVATRIRGREPRLGRVHSHTALPQPSTAHDEVLAGLGHRISRAIGRHCHQDELDPTGIEVRLKVADETGAIQMDLAFPERFHLGARRPVLGAALRVLADEGPAHTS